MLLIYLIVLVLRY